MKSLNSIYISIFITIISILIPIYAGAYEVQPAHKPQGRFLTAQNARPIISSGSAQNPIYSNQSQPPTTSSVTNQRQSAQSPLNSKSSAIKIDETVAGALRSGRIMLNFDNLDIKAVSKIMSQLTKKTILLDRSVSGNITIISSRKVSISEAWDLYLSALEASGFGVVNSSGAYKVIPLVAAKQENLKYVGTKPIKPSSNSVVALVLLNNADSEIMVNTLKPMVNPPAVIASYQPSNALIVTDSSQNVARLTQIIKQLDRNFKGATMRVFQPKYIRVKELATALQTVFQGGATTGGQGVREQVRFSAYEPTNTLLVMAPYKDFLQIEKAIAEIDIESRIMKSDERKFQVYYLKNATAEDVVKSISSLMEERRRIVETIQKEQGGTEAAKKDENIVSNKVSADAATNSLIFYATDKEYEELSKMVALLDAPQKQVLITAIIAETQADNSLDAGVAWQALAAPGVLANFQAGVDSSSLMQLIQGGGFALGAIGSETMELDVNGSKIQVPKLFGILKAMQTKTKFNLLSAPKVVTHDHKKASLIAAQQIPFAKGVSYNNNGFPVISYDYQKVGLNLDVTPHVGQNNQVRLEIKLKIEDLISYLTQGTGNSAVQTPVTSTREVDNIITLNDNDTIVIGGLIDQKTTEVIKQVPILSKIPLLGGLFKNKSTSKTVRTLFVFLTPHIIDNPDNLKQITDKYGRAVMRESLNEHKEQPKEQNPEIKSEQK